MPDKNVVELLFDSSNKKSLILTDSIDNKLAVEQIFATVIDNVTYCILVPLVRVKGLGKNEALVFKVGNNSLTVVADKKLAAIVFKEYYLELKKIQRNSEENG